MVNVAQLVEHQIVALVAVGSSPTIHPSKKRESREHIKKNFDSTWWQHSDFTRSANCP